MVAGFTPPDTWGETSSQLRKSQTVTLDANGKGSVQFSTDSANQRWVVTGIVINTNQSATASVVPFATGAINTIDISQMSPGNQLWTTYNGNNCTIGPPGFDLHPVDFFSVLWYPPPGQSGSSMAGVIATAVITGVKYTRRS